VARRRAQLRCGYGLARALDDAHRHLVGGWMVAVFPIGWTVSQLLLIIIFFVIFTAVAVVFRLIGRDALHRTFDRSAESYWIRRPMAPGVEQYFRQS
jgi:hypothetical protein